MMGVINGEATMIMAVLVMEPWVLVGVVAVYGNNHWWGLVGFGQLSLVSLVVTLTDGEV